MVEADAVRLRPIRPEDMAFLDELALPDVAGPFDHFDDPDEERIRATDVGAGQLIVELAGGGAIGDVSWFGVPYGPNRRSVAWKIGITIHPEHRGKGFGTRAQRLLAEHLFATTVANRIEADTDVDNVAEQRALVGAGFTREQTIRGAQYRDGQWRDLVMFSLLRGEA